MHCVNKCHIFGIPDQHITVDTLNSNHTQDVSRDFISRVWKLFYSAFFLVNENDEVNFIRYTKCEAIFLAFDKLDDCLVTKVFTSLF